MTTLYYRIAGFRLSVCLPADMDADTLLPSFCPFRVSEATGNEERLFDFTVGAQGEMPACETRVLLEETENDMGHLSLYATADGYLVEVANGCCIHCMAANSDFSILKACLQREDQNAGRALSSLLRIAYAQAILGHEAVSIHAAAVHRDGQAYLFMGKSGTGKSTHASLWTAHIPGTELLNDDNPTVRILNGKAYAYGTPWSGKTACYKNLSFPIGGMVRLNQAPANSFCRQEGADAFVALYPGCSVIAEDERLRGCLYDTLARLAGMVPVGILDCLPDPDAAWTCYRAFDGDCEERMTGKVGYPSWDN